MSGLKHECSTCSSKCHSFIEMDFVSLLQEPGPDDNFTKILVHVQNPSGLFAISKPSISKSLIGFKLYSYETPFNATKRGGMLPVI